MSLSAQVASQKGWFTADVNTGCAPFSITITNSGVRSAELFFDFFGDPNERFSGYGFVDSFTAGERVQNISSPYTQPGTYLIRVVEQSNNSNDQERFDFLEITVIEPTQPIFTAAVCNNNTAILEIDFTQDNYDFYEIDFGDASLPATLDKTGNNQLTYSYATQGTYTINVHGRLSGASNVSCSSADPITVTTLQNIPTPLINTIAVVDATTLDLTYNTLNTSVNYYLEMSENGGAFTSVAEIDPVANGLGFQFVSSQQGVDFNFGQYAFRLVASEECTNNPIVSNEMQNIRAGYQAAYAGNMITLDRMWSTQDPDNSLAAINLIYDGMAEGQTVSIQGNSTLDLSSCTASLPFYFEAAFGSSVSRSMIVTPDLSVQGLTPPVPTGLAGQIAGGALTLTYDAAPVTATEYRIYQSGPDGPELVETTSSQSVSITDFSLSESEVCYIVSYVDECGNESEPTAPVCFEFSPRITLPNAFSPNGDDHNDRFNVDNGIFLEFRMDIYNRWGKLIFSTTDAVTGWDGSVNGQPAPIGGYVYRINYNSGNGAPVSLSGSLTLIR